MIVRPLSGLQYYGEKTISRAENRVAQLDYGIRRGRSWAENMIIVISMLYYPYLVNLMGIGCLGHRGHMPEMAGIAKTGENVHFSRCSNFFQKIGE